MCDRKSVLIVDDDEHITFGVARRLEAEGYVIFSATDGKQGFDMARQRRPDVVLLDVRMPTLDGLAALGRLRADQGTRDIPVIMLSASLSDQKKALDAGARFFVRKPYDRDKLLTAVDQATRRS